MASNPAAAADIKPIDKIEEFVILDGVTYHLISGEKLKTFIIGYSIDAGISDVKFYQKDGQYISYTAFGGRKGHYFIMPKSVCRYEFKPHKTDSRSCVSYYYANSRVLQIDEYKNNAFVRKRALLPQD